MNMFDILHRACRDAQAAAAATDLRYPRDYPSSYHDYVMDAADEYARALPQRLCSQDRYSVSMAYRSTFFEEVDRRMLEEDDPDAAERYGPCPA